jgi:hypothetical protein
MLLLAAVLACLQVIMLAWQGNGMHRLWLLQPARVVISELHLLLSMCCCCCKKRAGWSCMLLRCLLPGRISDVPLSCTLSETAVQGIACDCAATPAGAPASAKLIRGAEDDEGA